jgi:putative sigma-54 modulation protein
MIVNVTARHFKLWPELHEAVVDAANKFTKFYDGITRTDIVLSEENGKFVEFTIHVEGHVFHGEDSAADFDKSIHHASDKIVAQLRKLKEKIKNHHAKDISEFL